MQNSIPAGGRHHRVRREQVLATLAPLRLVLIVVDSETAMVFHSTTQLLWNARPTFGVIVDSSVAVATVVADIGTWRLPLNKQLTEFYQAGHDASNWQPQFFQQPSRWHTVVGTMRVGTPPPAEDARTLTMEVNNFLVGAPLETLLDLCLERGWTLQANDDAGAADLLAPLRAPASLRMLLEDADYRATRLPLLDAAQFDDPAKGVWECWGLSEEVLRTENVRARDPAVDVRDWDVAIDFGTSSTVVAYEENGQRKLLRAGISNFWQEESARNYENPTMLEFLDWEKLLQAWQSTAYRPPVEWDHVRASHAALADLRDSSAPQALVGSMIGNLKQWALRAEDGERVYLRDARLVERELLPLTARNPVLGTPLTTGADDRFDPVELYAWLLGLNINWRGRGLFLRYAMTFPVAYPQAIKDKILASFRRGLQRSLPGTLVGSQAFSRFRVDEIASEPAAYAIAALPGLGVAPSASGVAYAVFDFGGGTADFDFGLYRLPNEAEDPDLEQVLERLGSAGDRHLGGENLLANMAYQVFRWNLDGCERDGIVFSKPLDAATFNGHERFVEQSRIAAVNTTLLANALRPLWEEGSAESQIRINLLDRSGATIECCLDLPLAELAAYLETRIGQGLFGFLVAMEKAFHHQRPAEIQVLLAGNSSRSRLVGGYFGLDDTEEGQRLHERTVTFLAQLFGEQSPRLAVHPALAANDDDLFRPTAKTGVALGLLRLCPGGVAAVVDSTGAGVEAEAPFACYVGRIRQGRFASVLGQGHAYGVWLEVARLREHVFKLSYSHSPLAHTGQLAEGAAVLSQLRLEFAGDVAGQGLYLRAVGPSEIEVCTATALAEAGGEGCHNLQRLSLA